MPRSKWLCMIGLAAAVACARAPDESPKAREATLPAGPGTPDKAAVTASATTAHYGKGEIETACNGIDDDGDGLIDVLLPVGPNECDTHLRGACAKGYAACEDGKLVCLAPPPMPEVKDGIDNDCNGIVDDVPEVAVHPRALVVAPPYSWKDAIVDVANTTATLKQAGIPFDKQSPTDDWRLPLGNLSGYTLVLVPGYLLGSAITPDVRNALEQFASQGGVVMIWKPLGRQDETQAWQLTGLKSATRHRDVTEIRITGEAPVTAAVDSAEERRLGVNVKASKDAVEVWALQPDPDANTETIATAYVGGKDVGAAITRRRIGKGSIYASGHDLVTFDASRCYVNCFEPSGDLLRFFLEGGLREGSSGHIVIKHTAPSEASSVLLLTHDIDAPDSQNAGEWGEPGALQAAHAEKARGLRATYNITTDYVAGYFNDKILTELCTLGMCPLGAHSVVHSLKFATLPLGTCNEDRATYGKPATLTLCGEIHVSTQIIAQITGTSPRVWRAPYLAINPRQFDMLPKNGYAYDSGFGIGDLPYNLPIDLAAVGFHQDRFHHAPMLEMPIACEDGIDAVDKSGQHRRVELMASNHDKFVALWRYIVMQNAHNRAITTLLMHPSRGRDQPLDNVGVKIHALENFLDFIAGEDVIVRPLEEIGDFWRARLETELDATFAAGEYNGTVTSDTLTARGLTLEFGDAIKSFRCDKCGPTRIRGKRVVIVNGLPPRTAAAFVATAGLAPPSAPPTK